MPREVGQYNKHQVAHGLVVEGGYVYSTVGGGVRGWGLLVLEFKGSGR